MSFDIHLMVFRNGKPCAANRDAARALVDSIDHQLEIELNAYDLIFHDGASIEMYAAGLYTDGEPFQGAMIAIRGLSNSICDLIYNFCVASSCIAIPVMDSACVLVADEKLVAHLPDGFGENFPVVHIRSGADVVACSPKTDPAVMKV